MFLLSLACSPEQAPSEPSTEPQEAAPVTSEETAPTPEAGDEIDPLSHLFGTWQTDIPGGPAGGAWIAYTFKGYAYTQSGYPEWTGSGRARFVELTADALTAELYERTENGAPAADVTIEVALNADPPSFTIADRTYTLRR